MAKTFQLAVAVYKLTHGFPREELYGMTVQIRRSAVSIPSNIAEGQGRLNTAEFKQFLGIARGSTCELQTQLEIARALGYSDPGEVQKVIDLSHEIGKMLFVLIGSLRAKAVGR